jgi:cell wall-associated NlpC family hydrolase
MTNHTAARQAIVDEAMGWERTPYHHHARIKGVGVDCAQLPLAVYVACGLIEPFEPDYTQDWMMHRDEERYLDVIRARAVEIDRADVGPGDMAVFKFGRTFSHSSIVIDLPLIIHAVIRGGAVLRADMDTDGDLIGREVKFFTLFRGRD